MADSLLNFDIVGNATSAAKAFADTAAGADEASAAVDRLKGKEDAAGTAGQDAGNKAGNGFLAGIRDALGKGGNNNILTGAGGGGGIGGFLNAGGIAGGALPGIAGISGLAATITGIGAALVAVLPALTAVAGGIAAIGGGFAILMLTNATFKTDVMNTFSSISKVLGQAASVMAGPLLQALSQFAGFVAKIGPDLTQVFTATIPLIQPLVSGLEGLLSGAGPGFLALLKAAAPAMQAFSQLLSDLGSSLGDMFSSFSQAIGPSAKILEGLGDIINAIFPFLGEMGRILATSVAPAFLALGQALSQVLPALDPLFNIIGQFAGAALSDLGSVFQALATFLSGLAPAFTTLASVAGPVFSMFENSGVFASLGNALESIAAPLANLVDQLVKGLAPAIPVIVDVLNTLGTVLTTIVASGLGVMISALSDVLKFLQPVLPLIVEVVAAVKAWTVVQGLLNILLDANPIGLIVLAIAALIGLVVELVRHWKEVEHVAGEVWNAVKSAVETAFNWIKEHWPLLLEILTGPIGLAVVEIVKHWHAIVDGVQQMWDDVTGFFKRLPGDIISALGDVGRLLFNAGVNVVRGLLDGIKSMFGEAGSVVGSLAHKVAGFFGLSPAVEGPLSGGGAPRIRGQHLVQDIADGMRDKLSGLSSMAGTVAGAAGGAFGTAGAMAFAGAGAGGGGNAMTLYLSGGEGPITNAIMEAIRAEAQQRGGGSKSSVQIAFGVNH